ncbi:flagellar protein FlaG [Shewanella surugensis]|uniref:Flagellar protein FlaG n=1 Tax=Shewanella surugensis TaxID=212020 RepID=A0ABT0LDQ0_9GAMM|nr:flagellar protein FlaG [Shewanella surugensis]MCL1125457.1 flagellar protein FlaG [Shewanella surugensis]
MNVMEINVTESLLSALATVIPIEAVSGENQTDDRSPTSWRADDKLGRKVIQDVDKAEAPQTNQARLQNVLDSLSSMQALQRTALQFSLDEAAGKSVIRVVDLESGMLIRQLPSEAALVLLQKLDEIKGLLIETQV